MSDDQGQRIRFCSQCGADVAFDETTCPSCGHVEGGWPAPEGPASSCASCGGEVPARRAYCPHCSVPQIQAAGVVPEAGGARPAEEADGAGRALFATTVVLAAPALLAGALALALA